MCLLDQYLKYCEQYELEYGDKTAVFMEVGSFMEIYGIDLPNQKIQINSTGASESFEINAYKKENMLNGYDDIDYLESMKEDIKTFAVNRPL